MAKFIYLKRRDSRLRMGKYARLSIPTFLLGNGLLWDGRHGESNARLER